MKMEKQAERQIGIDLAKLVCAVLVVTIHFSPFGKHPDTYLLTTADFYLRHYLCRVAVPFFFLCNGYFLFRKSDPERPDFKKIGASVRRVAILYLFWSVVYFPKSLSTILNDRNGMLHGCLRYLRDFLLVGSFGHLWYLNGLIVAFLLIRFCLKRKMKPRAILALSAVLYLIGLLDDSFSAVADRIGFLKTLFGYYNRFFVTTRNGVFFGFFFVSFGMVMGSEDFAVSRRNNLLKFLLAMAGLLLETMMKRKFSLAKDANMSLFLIPAVYYLFALSAAAKIPCTEKNRRFGPVSRLMFYTHEGIGLLVKKIAAAPAGSLPANAVSWLITVLCSFAVSAVIVRLSDRFRWMKKLY